MNMKMDVSPLKNNRLAELFQQASQPNHPTPHLYDQYLFTDSIIFHPKLMSSTPKPSKKIEIIRSKEYSKCSSNSNTNKFLMHRSKVKNSKMQIKRNECVFLPQQQKKTALCIGRTNASTYFSDKNEGSNKFGFSNRLISFELSPKKINKSLLEELSAVIRKFKINRPFSGFRSQSCETRRVGGEVRREHEIKPWDFKRQEEV